VKAIVQRIKEAAAGLGFSVTGITSVAPLVKDLSNLEEWIGAGFAAEMDYMVRRPSLKGQPGELVPYAASIVSLAVNYFSPAPLFKHENRYGRIARYAWGRDYHEVVRPRLVELAASIDRILSSDNRTVNTLRYRSFVDAVPLLERAVAQRAGIGFFGKNTNILQPRAGSWYFLSELLIAAELPEEGPSAKVSCGSCNRCIDACPTGAFAGPFRLDSRRCISYLTIENKGPIPLSLRAQIGEWLFGCDVCQDVCPFNRFSVETNWPDLRPEAGPGTRIDLTELLSIASDVEFRSRFAGTALTRPKRRGLLRNAAVVAGNIGCTAALPALLERVERDPEPLIRQHAIWAAARLDERSSHRFIARVIKNDPDPVVRDEARAVLETEFPHGPMQKDDRTILNC
jgi:epoxyqueuosine reductase